MAKKISLIGRMQYYYNENITINIPTIAQIRGQNEKDEARFWHEVGLFIRTPNDMVSELDAMGKDFESISDYELFTMLTFLKDDDTKSAGLFQGFSIKDLTPVYNNEKEIVFIDKNDTMIINEPIYNDISYIIAEMTGNKKTPKEKFGNELAKKKWIERDYRLKKKARKNADNNESVLDSIILRLVCNSNFPYDYRTIQDCTIYDTIQGLRQIDKDIQVNDLMQSRLVGVDLKKFSRDDLSRFAI